MNLDKIRTLLIAGDYSSVSLACIIASKSLHESEFIVLIAAIRTKKGIDSIIIRTNNYTIGVGYRRYYISNNRYEWFHDSEINIIFNYDTGRKSDIVI